MNTKALEVKNTDVNQAAIADALEKVAQLVTTASSSLSHDAQARLAGLLKAGAQLEVCFTLTHERKLIIASIENIPFFSIDIGEPTTKEATRH